VRAFFRKIKNNPDYNQIDKAINTSICLGSLGLAQILKGTIVAAFPSLLSYFFFMQFFGSTIQGSFSDVCRRSSVLNVAFCVLAMTLSLLIFSHTQEGYFFSILRVICIGLIGLGGNADVVGRAEIIDIHYHADRRKIMSWTVLAEAFSWVIIGVLIRFIGFDPFDVLTLCLPLTIFMLIASLFFNTDGNEGKKQIQNVFNEFKLILKFQKTKLFLITSIIIIGECAYFFFFYPQENHVKDPMILADSYMFWFIGMSIGCCILNKIKHFNDFIFLMLGFGISLFSIMFFVLNGAKNIADPGMFSFDALIYGIAGLGSGFYLPCFYSVISRGHSTHFQGILTGWVDSLRVFGDAVSNAVLLGLAIFPIFIPIAISVFLFFVTILLLMVGKKRVF
jgi:MFS family permease